MNRAEFDLGFLNLKNAYGQAKYPDVRADFFFKSLKGINFSEFNEGVLEIIATDDKAPMLERLQEKFRDALARNKREYEMELTKNVDCYLCKNRGFVYYRNGISATSVSKCKCDLHKLWPSYPPLNERRLADIM